MKIPFRHGLVRFQTDIAKNPTFVRKASGGSVIDLVVQPTSTIYSIAHYNTDYLFEERKTVLAAWTGFTAGPNYWIYFDIDIMTGARTFGKTIVAPVISPTAPVSPAVDLHWFDKTENVMKVWSGSLWKEVLRIFAAQYQSGSVLIPYTIGTQVGLNQATLAGFVLFDDEDKPVRKFTRGRKSQFIHSESVLSTVMSGGVVSFTFENAMNVVEAVEPIPEYRLVVYKDSNKIGLSSSNQPFPIVGLVTEDFMTGQLGSYVNEGFISNEMWAFAQPAGTPLFCSPTGEVTTSVPGLGYLQQIGTIVSPQTIYLKIGTHIKL